MRRRGAGWSATVQLVTLALLLAFVSPLSAAARTHEQLVPAALLSLGTPTSDPAAEDLCPVCHHYCGCHQAAVLARAAELPPRLAQAAEFRRENWQTQSIVTECPRKPPRV